MQLPAPEEPQLCLRYDPHRLTLEHIVALAEVASQAETVMRRTWE